MNTVTNSLQYKSLGASAKNAPPEVLNAIKTASAKTGVDFSYLVTQASVESSFKADARNKASSATGLYQFIDSTWLQMVDRYGDDFGIETDGKSKGEILALRKDPKAASLMAAAFASENEQTLQENWGGDIGATELYLAHFMGANGASSFLKARDENPLRPAADLFPAAARSNRNVFYDPETGKARSLQEVYSFFDQKFDKNTGPASAEQPSVFVNKTPSNDDIVNALLNAQPTQSFSPSRGLSDSIVMVKAQEMREARNENTLIQLSALGTGHRVVTTPSYTVKSDRTPFYTMTTSPVDIMLLAQNGDKRHIIG